MRTLLYYLYEDGDENPIGVKAEIADNAAVPDKEELEYVKEGMLREHVLSYFNNPTLWYVELLILDDDKVVSTKTSI